MLRFSRATAVLSLLGVWMLLVSAGCGDDSTKPKDSLQLECGSYAVITTDYSFGGLSEVSADTTGSVLKDLASIHSDAVGRSYQGLIFVVNRFGQDNVQVIDPGANFTTIRQIPVGAGSNPHDIAFVSAERAYVSRYSSDGLLEINPATGAILDTISLAAFADGDGVPDMDRLLYRAPYLYVSIERIDFGGGTYMPVAPSWLAVVDTRSNDVVDVDPATPGIQGIRLAGLNPSAPMIFDDAEGLLLVPEVGAYGILDGGVEKVDLTSGVPAGWLVREESLGGDLIDFALGRGGHAYATVALAGGTTALVAFDTGTGERIGEAIYTSPGYDLSDLAVTDCGALIVCDMNYENPGLRIYDAVSGRPVSMAVQPISVGRRPFELVKIE
jgi:hypothetical protein